MQYQHFFSPGRTKETFRGPLKSHREPTNQKGNKWLSNSKVYTQLLFSSPLVPSLSEFTVRFTAYFFFHFILLVKIVGTHFLQLFVELPFPPVRTRFAAPDYVSERTTRFNDHHFVKNGVGCFSFWCSFLHLRKYIFFFDCRMEF